MAKNYSEKNIQTAAQIFAGGGEMGARMRELDWSKTPLGAVETWSSSLQTAVRLILNSRFSMFIWWGENLVYLYNDAYLPTLGIHHPEALGKSAHEVWSEIWQDIESQVQMVLERGEATWNEEMLLFLERSGFKEETYHTFSYSPIIDDSGKIGGLFCAVSEETQKVLSRRRLQTLRDLGERTLAEAQTIVEACRAACETLTENDYDFPFALIYLLEEDGKTARLAEAIRLDKNSKPAPAEIIIGSDSDVWNLNTALETKKSQSIENLTEKFGRLTAGGWADDFTKKAFVLPLAKSGVQEFPAGFMVCGISPRLRFDDDYRSFLELAAGHTATAIANARALETERKRAEALAELDRAKTEFFSNVSHEFRTPLTLMLGNLEDVLRRDRQLPENEREQIEAAHRNSLRLLKLVNNLLDFSRIEAGRAAAHFEQTDLARLTADLASNFRAGIEKAGIKLTVDCPPLSQMVGVDREMWEKIVLNLLSNAFKFTLRGEIEVALRESEAGVELTVRDTGAGIPAEELPNIFQRFHRVRTVQGRTHEGTGIGLALVQELVKLHRGDISVASEVGRGTVFTVTIPFFGKEEKRKMRKAENSENISVKPLENWQSYLLDSAEAMDFTAQTAESKPALLPFYPSAKILLADDNADMRGYISRLLAQNGYSVEAVKDGQEAIEKLRDSGADLPDLVLTDVMMPRMDGFQLIEEIRRSVHIREIPVIMLSARAGEESKIEGYEAGADDYLIKPFSAREMLARVSSLIELTKMRRAVEAEREKSFAVLESVTDAFYALDRNFCFAYLNQKAEEYLGKNREELIGQNIWELFPGVTGTTLQTEFENAFRENKPVGFEFLSPFSNRWNEIHAYPSREWLLVYLRDITERIQIQETLAETVQSLARERERLNIALLTGALGAYEWHVGDETIWWSPEVYPLYGVNPATFTPTVESFGALIHPDDREELWRKSEECITERKVFNHEYRIIRPDGEVRWIYNRSHVGLNAEGVVERITGVAADITERKKTEQAVQKSEAEFRMLADAVPQIVWVTDGEGKVIYVNEHWREFSGLGVEETGNREMLVTQFHPDDRLRILEEWSRAFKNKTTFEVEGRMRNQRTGEYSWFLMRSEPTADADGNIIKWFGTSTDITANKKAENRAVLMAEISELARKFENPGNFLYAVSKAVGEHFEARRCLFNEIDLENDIEIVHRDYCHGIESVAGKHKISAYSPVTSAEMEAGITVVNRDSKIDPRTAHLYEETYKPAGERAYIAVPLLRENRWVASLWVSTDEPRDWGKGEISLLEFIAEQVWAVVEKLRIDAALRESEKRFRNMADHAPVMIWVTDPTGYCNYLSQSWYEFTGQTPETALGFGWLEATHPDDAGRAEAEFIGANEKHAPFRLEYRLRRKDGEYRWAIDSAQPRFGEEGEFLGYIGSVIDITDRKRAEQEREKLLAQEKILREEAERANRLKDEFLATVSHELRTPLNSMLGWAAMVRQNNYNTEIMRRAFEVVERNARNQNQIISDILDVSRIITGKLNLNLQPVELSAAVQAAIDTIRPAADAKRIRLETDFEPDAEMITGDADRIQQIVWNLLSNAVKFTPEAGRIEIASRFSDRYVEISVADDGSGIKPEFLPFVFDRFSQADGKMNRRHGGLGLGLAIVRHLTELHGGSVSVQSAGEGHGSIFTVRFPLKLRFADTDKNGSEDSDNQAEAISETGGKPAGRLEGLRILVVDDEPDALELSAFILTDQNALVFTAESVDQALEIFAAETLDAIVSDIGMPEKDGLDLIQEIKARSDGQITPTVALTAYARKEDSRRVLEAGYDAYLPKPVEPEKLIETVLEIIEEK